MKVTGTGPQTVQKALGETIKLGCTYTPASQDIGELDIEWSNLNPDMTKTDQLVGLRGETSWYFHPRGGVLLQRYRIKTIKTITAAQSPDLHVEKHPGNSFRRDGNGKDRRANYSSSSRHIIIC